MTYQFKCDDCALISEHSFRPVKFDDRPDAVAPLRMADRESVLACPSCGGDSHYDAEATIQASANFTFKADPIDIWEKKGYRPIDINHGGAEAKPSRHRTTTGVHRVIPGLPGRLGGHRLPGADGE